MSRSLPLKLQVGKLQLIKELLNTQTCLRDKHIETFKGGHIRVNMGDGMGERTKIKFTGRRALTMGPANMIAMKVDMQSPMGQTGGAERAIRPLWPAHIEAELRVKGREVVQMVAAIHNLPAPKDSVCVRICPPHIPVVKSSLSRAKRTEKNSSVRVCTNCH